MRIYEVRVVYPCPGDATRKENGPLYDGILADTDDEAIAKAEASHRVSDWPAKLVEFLVENSRVVLCPTAVQEAA